MNTPDNLRQLRHKRDEAVLAIGAIDKEIQDALKDVPPLKVGDVYVTEPFQHCDNNWVICYYIIVEQDERQIELRSNTNNGTHARLKTLHFVVEQGHNHTMRYGFNKSHPRPHMSTWEYVYTSRRWIIDTDWGHDQPHFLCNLAEDKHTREYWGNCAIDEDTPAIEVMLRKELMQGMNDLEMPNHFVKDEVWLDVGLKINPEIYCLRMWATDKLMQGYDGLPDWMHVKSGWAQPFRWYSSDGRYSDKGMFTLTEEGWLDSSLEIYTPNDADNTSDTDMANWASHLELVEYDKNN